MHGTWQSSQKWQNRYSHEIREWTPAEHQIITFTSHHDEREAQEEGGDAQKLKGVRLASKVSQADKIKRKETSVLLVIIGNLRSQQWSPLEQWRIRKCRCWWWLMCPSLELGLKFALKVCKVMTSFPSCGQPLVNPDWAPQAELHLPIVLASAMERSMLFLLLFIGFCLVSGFTDPQDGKHTFISLAHDAQSPYPITLWTVLWM